MRTIKCRPCAIRIHTETSLLFCHRSADLANLFKLNGLKSPSHTIYSKTKSSKVIFRKIYLSTSCSTLQNGKKIEKVLSFHRHEFGFIRKRQSKQHCRLLSRSTPSALYLKRAHTPKWKIYYRSTAFAVERNPLVASHADVLVDCEQSLFFFRFSEGSAHARESRAMKPFVCLSFCSTVYRKKRDCPLSNVLWGSSRVSALREANRRPVDFVYFLFFREFDHNDL